MNLEELKGILPANILEIAGVIGYPSTLRLIDKLGGLTFPFGKGVSALGVARFNLLISAVGRADADKLAKHFSGEDFYIPRCAAALRELRNQRFLSEFDERREHGESASMCITHLCPRYGFTDRFAWELLNKYNRTQHSKQDSLF